MRKFFSSVAFILSLILHVQSMAWAAGVATPESKALLERIVKHYNGLSHTDKVAQMKKMLADRPEADRAFIQKSLGDLNKVKFPELSQQEDSYVFTWDKQEIIITPVKDDLYKVNGHQVNSAPGKLSEMLTMEDKLFPKTTTSVFDFIISPVYAGPGPIVSIIGLIALIVSFITFSVPAAVIGGVLALGGGVMSLVGTINDGKVKNFCDNARTQMSSLKTDASPGEIFEVKQTIMRAKSDMQAEPKCLSGDKERLEICKQVRLCLESLDKEIDLYLNAVNRDAREKVKEIEKNYGPNKPVKATSKQ